MRIRALVPMTLCGILLLTAAQGICNSGPQPASYYCEFKDLTNWSTAGFTGSVSAPAGCPFGVDYAGQARLFTAHVIGKNGVVAYNIDLMTKLYDRLGFQQTYFLSRWHQLVSTDDWYTDPQGQWPAAAQGFTTDASKNRDSAVVEQPLITSATNAKAYVPLPYWQTPAVFIIAKPAQAFVGETVQLSAYVNGSLIPNAVLSWKLGSSNLSDPSPYRSEAWSTTGTRTYSVTATSQTTGATYTATKSITWSTRK